MSKIGFPGLLFLVFLVLKLTNVIAWSWIWVTCPLWGGIAIWLGLTILIGLGLMATAPLRSKAKVKAATRMKSDFQTRLQEMQKKNRGL